MASPKSKIKKIHILLKEQMEGVSAYDIDDHYYMCLRSSHNATKESWEMFPLRQEPIGVLQNVVNVMDEHQEYLFLYVEFEDDAKTQPAAPVDENNFQKIIYENRREEL